MRSLAVAGSTSGLTPAQLREHQAHLARIEQIGALTVRVAGQTNATVKHVTQEAIAELRGINADVVHSSLPAVQQQQLRAQVADALMRHERLLDVATRESQRVLHQEIARSSPPRTSCSPARAGLFAFAEEIDNTVHALTGNIFRR